MTFAEKLTHVSKDDPKFARSVQRMRIASWLFGVGVALAIGIGIWSVAVNYQQGTQITRIESPCLKYGSKSRQCREAFEAAVATITHPQACAIERKAGTLRAIRELATNLEITFNEPCAGARIAQERQRGNERASARGGRAASQPAPATGHAPALAPAGDAPAPHKPVSREPKVPPAPAPGGGGGEAPAATSPAATGPTAPTDPPGDGNGPHEGMPEQASGPFGDITGSVGGAVHEVGKGLDKAACPALDRLAGLCSAPSP